MIIHSNNLTLRSYELTDISDFYNMTHDDEVQNFVPYAYSADLEDAYEFINDHLKVDNSREFFFIIENENNELVGSLIGMSAERQHLELILLTDKKHRRKGYMKSAILTFKNWLKNNSTYKALKFVIEKTNTSSLKLIEEKLSAEKKYTDTKFVYFTLKI